MTTPPPLIRPRIADGQPEPDSGELLALRRRLIAIATDGRFLDPDHAHVDELRELARLINTRGGTESLGSSMALVAYGVGQFEAEMIDRIWDGVAGWRANWAVNHQLDMVH